MERVEGREQKIVVCGVESARDVEFLKVPNKAAKAVTWMISCFLQFFLSSLTSFN
jgi:hypothetical protein